MRSGGTYVRDYMHLIDAARSYVELAGHMDLRPQLRGEACNSRQSAGSLSSGKLS
jgi:hypothetical protein